MKFNDKELSRWSTMFNPDKEGLLDKKGAGKGQGTVECTEHFINKSISIICPD